jgi:lipoprotein-anchoring transpeptidase ErfK/SrfK
MTINRSNILMMSVLSGVFAVGIALAIPQSAQAAINPSGTTSFFSKIPSQANETPESTKVTTQATIKQAATTPPVTLAAPQGLESPVTTAVDPAPAPRKNIPTQLASLKATRWAQVVVHEQRAYFWQNGRIIKSVRISSGLPGTPTNIGEHKIFKRVYNERMVGPGYDLSNVLYTQYFNSEYEGFHYAYWHNNFGTPQSHGCVNMTLADSKWLWDWAFIGMRVSVVN